MNQQNTSKNMEPIVSLVLQFGVIVSSAIIVIGIILLFTTGLQNQTSYQGLTVTSYSFPHSLSLLIMSIQAGKGVGFIELGVLLLILTPILRVATSILLFMRQKDTPMTLVTLFVLITLVGSFILGLTVR